MTLADLKNEIRKAMTSASTDEALEIAEDLRNTIHNVSPLASQPIDRVRWVPIEKVEPNDYNPNMVAGKEMGLLYTSISHDGYTQPVVTIYDEAKKKYVIVDGFHRYYTCLNFKDIRDRNRGMLPIVVIDKDINDRMAATVRHNRARGEHSINGMGDLVFQMLNNGWSDPEICKEIGLEPEELLKLKHITGYSALFKNAQHSKAWETSQMVRDRLRYKGTK